MISTEFIKYLSEVDTNIFLSLNGMHSPFWDYFMKTFTGKFIWVPMYATILYILLKISLESSGVLCSGLALTLLLPTRCAAASFVRW